MTDCEFQFDSSDTYPLGAWTCVNCGEVVSVPWQSQQCQASQMKLVNAAPKPDQKFVDAIYKLVAEQGEAAMKDLNQSLKTFNSMVGSTKDGMEQLRAGLEKDDS